MYAPRNPSFDPYKRVKKIAKLLGFVFLYRLYEWWTAPEVTSQKALENVTTVAINGSVLLGASGLVIYGMEKLAHYLNHFDQQNNQHLPVHAVPILYNQNPIEENTVHPSSIVLKDSKKLR